MTRCEHALTLITAGNQVYIKKYCSFVYNEYIYIYVAWKC
jgi:hypothetical protein